MFNANNSSIVNSEHLLETIIKDEHIDDYIITTSNVPGDRFSSTIVAIDVHGKNSDKNKHLCLMRKTAIKSDALRNEYSISQMYNREIYLYTTVFPIFYLLEEQNGLPRSSFAPKLYKCRTDVKNEELFLENLKGAGYHLMEGTTSMDENHVRSVMIKFGRMHALSLAFRDQNKDDFIKTCECMDDMFENIIRKTCFKQHLLGKCIQVQDVFDKNTDGHALKVYKRFLDDIEQVFDDLKSSRDQYSVILHGDAWKNNILFKYEFTNTSVPVDACFVDFQMSRIGSPALDLAYFFYSCSSINVIDKLDEFLEIYYDSLSTYFRKLGSNPDKLIPYAVLQDHWKKYAKIAVIVVPLIIYIYLTKTEKKVDLTEIVESGNVLETAFDYDIEHTAEYNKRVRHILLHFIRNGFI